MNNDRDQELEQQLALLRKAVPSSAQLARWREAMEETEATNRFRWSRWSIPQMAATLLLGFLLGAFTMGRMAPSQMAEKTETSATIEEIYAKSE